LDIQARDFNWRQPASFFQVVWGAARRPVSFFRTLPPEGGLLSPLIFLVVVQASPLAAVLLKGAPPGVALANFLSNLLLSLLFASLFCLTGRFLMRSALPLAGFFRVYAYSCGVWVLSALAPFLPSSLALPLIIALALYVLILLFVGLRVGAGLSLPLAAGVLVISVMALALLLSLLGPAQTVTTNTAG
jgi:hypothetical protein